MEIVRRESQKEPGKCSRVWCHKDAFNVLRDKTETMKRVKELVQFGGFLDTGYLQRTLAKEFQQMESCFKQAFELPFTTISKKILFEDLLRLFPVASSPKSASLSFPTSISYYREASEAVTTYKTHEQRLVDYISFRIPEDSFSNIRNCIGIARGFMHDLSSVKKGNASLEAVLLSVPDGYHYVDLCLCKMENEKVRNIPQFVVAPLAASGNYSLDARGMWDMCLTCIQIGYKKNKNTGTTTIEGLSLNLEDMPAKSASGAQSQNEDSVAEHAMFNKGNSLKRRRRGLFSFLRVIPAFTESFSESDEDDFKTDVCSQMHASRLLQLNNPGSVVRVLHSWRGSRVGKRHRKPDLLKNSYCRLKYICNKEGLKASSIALTALVEYTVLEISSQMVGRKDTSKSVFDVWTEIFQKRTAKRERKTASGCSSISNEFDFLHSMISNR
ncbi:unnamed protein product [Camellia sinensis]